MQTVTLSEFCRIVKKVSGLQRNKGKSSLGTIGRRPWKMGRTWVAPSNNPSVYRNRYVLKVCFGTGETLLYTAIAVEKNHIS
jgi:hypothetical protein